MLDRTAFGGRLEDSSPADADTKKALLVDVVSNRSPTSDDGKVGRRIKEFRRNQGLTQKQVAWRIGVTGAQLHRYEAGATRIAASRLIAIATALGVQPEVLMGGATVRLRAPEAPVDALSTDDLMEIVELFSALTDERRRGAMLAFARSVSRSG